LHLLTLLIAITLLATLHSTSPLTAASNTHTDEKSAPAKKSPERWEPDVQKLEQALIKRWAIRDKAIKTNQLVSELCKSHPLAIFVDTWPAGLNPKGEPSKDLLADDDLHLNDNGYKIWNSLLQTALDSSP
ncbi:MAG: hypothetical protein ACK6EB_30325, partial [Planctomyces sp.]